MKSIAKKEYEKPKMTVFELKLTNSILAGSVGASVDDEDSGMEWGGNASGQSAY